MEVTQRNVRVSQFAVVFALLPSINVLAAPPDLRGVRVALTFDDPNRENDPLLTADARDAALRATLDARGL